MEYGGLARWWVWLLLLGWGRQNGRRAGWRMPEAPRPAFLSPVHNAAKQIIFLYILHVRAKESVLEFSTRTNVYQRAISDYASYYVSLFAQGARRLRTKLCTQFSFPPFQEAQIVSVPGSVLWPHHPLCLKVSATQLKLFLREHLHQSPTNPIPPLTIGHPHPTSASWLGMPQPMSQVLLPLPHRTPLPECFSRLTYSKGP